MTQVYGGKGKVKVRRRLWGGAEEKDPKKYSVKYLGPEKAAAVLEKALQSVKVYMPPPPPPTQYPTPHTIIHIASHHKRLRQPFYSFKMSRDLKVKFLLRICRGKVVCGNSLSVWRCRLCSLASDISMFISNYLIAEIYPQRFLRKTLQSVG